MNQPFDKKVNLKLLYTFDDANTFLARSTTPTLAKIITLPSQPPHNGAQIGCVPLRVCLEVLQAISPEWFQKGMDYSIYYKDIIESGEPYVASGLCSNILSANDQSGSPSLLVTGRLCANFLNLYQPNSSADTLDIKLRLSPLHSVSLSNKRSNDHFYTQSSSYPETQHQQQQEQQQLQQQQQLAPPISSTTSSASFSTQQPPSNQPRKRSKKHATSVSSLQPQLASRTQSLPFITEDSLAHRIRLSDMLSKVDEEVDSNGESISSRFSNFSKKSTMDDDSIPTKAKKTKSFIQSVVRIGDNAIEVNTKPQKSSTTKQCVNCLTAKNPPYKFYRDGLFEMANSGYLCITCSTHQNNNDTKLLRERGQLGARGLLDGPYAGNNVNASTSKPRRTKKRAAFGATLGIAGSSNSSSLLASSSPIIESSPMALNSVAASRKRPQLIQQHQQQQHQQQLSVSMAMPDYASEDLMDLLKLDANFGHFKSMSMLDTQVNANGSASASASTNPSGLDAIDDIFRAPIAKFNSSSNPSAASSNRNSKNNTPDDDYYKDIDNVPVDAMKLNTTLIPLEDDTMEENKENCPPPPLQGQEPLQRTMLKAIPESSFISPSIQRIIDSFSAAADTNGTDGDVGPSSPTKEANEWNYDFFEEHERTTNNASGRSIGDPINSSQVDALHTECDDPEINRILGIDTSKSAQKQQQQHPRQRESISVDVDVDVTPRDPGTNTQQQESPTHASTKADHTTKTQTQTQTQINTPAEDAKSGTPLQKMKRLAKPSRVAMPSSPFFQISNEDDDDDGDGHLHDDNGDEKTADTTLATMAHWAATSSPVTEPMSACMSDRK
jgi:hypothetical protein